MNLLTSYPSAVDTKLVGTYPASAASGGGYVWDEVLEYRVWCHPASGADDHYYAFATYQGALEFSGRTAGADAPVALIRQAEYIHETDEGRYVHVKGERMTEWPVEHLARPRRKSDTIPRFLAPDAPANRLDILRGTSS